MKKFFTTATCLFVLHQVFSQSPKIYVNLVSHNEMIDEHYDTSQTEYDNAKTVALQILNHINSIGGKWNFQTCSKFVLGALNWDQAANSSTDLLETLYSNGVEIDPRNKTEFPDYNYNISDVYHLLDSCGVTSTHTVGGFLAYPYSTEDWTQFRTPKFGTVYGLPWQAEIIWGGGSPNHVQDLNDYGVWKPMDGDTYEHLYTHDSNANLWMVGNGCAPVITDTTTDIQWILNLINSNASHVLNGDWPADKFYCLTLMINVRDFDEPGYLNKVTTCLDAIDAQVTAGAMQWATISEKLSAFETWSTGANVSFSQWSCTEATAGIESENPSRLELFPNPVQSELIVSGITQTISYTISTTQGKILNFGTLDVNNERISLANYHPGLYVVCINGITYKIFKE